MLNQRQKKLYAFLLEKSTTNRYIPKEEICTALGELYPRNEEKTNEHSSGAFALIRKDIRAINGSDAYKIVVSSNKGYKIATKQEALEFIDRRFKRDLKSLKINWNLKNKIANDGQYRMASEDMWKEIKTFMERG